MVALATGFLALLAALVELPLVAAGLVSPRYTATVGIVTVTGAVLAGLPHDAFSETHVAALIAVALVAPAAVALSAERRAREEIAAFATFLGDSSTLLACSLDFDVTAKAVASIPVPELADWCLVELGTPEGAVERRAASHPDDAAEQVAACIAATADGERRPRSELWGELPDALLETWAAGDAERLERMRDAGARAAMRVPLRTGERALGTMTLLATGDRDFGERDLRRVEDLAARCAVAIENAQLYRAARRADRRFSRRAESPPGGRPAPRGEET